MIALKRLSKPTNDQRAGWQPWLMAGLLVALAPTLHTVVTWDLDGRLMPQAFAVRHYSYIIVLIEICVIWLAARNSLSIKDALGALPKYVSILLGIWFVFAIAGLFSSTSDLANATFILSRYTIHGFFLIATVHLLRKSDDFEIRRWLLVLSIGAVVYVLLLAIFCMLVPDPKNFPWVLRVPSATNIRQIGNNVGILAIAPIALLLAKGKYSTWQYAATFIIVFAFATWTGSRATILGFAIGITTGLLLVRNFTSVRNIVISAFSALAAILSSLLMPVPDPSFGLFRLVKASGEQADPSSGRWELWAQTWQQIIQSPWIGHGAGRYTKQMNLQYGTEWNHPHNFMLQYFYDWGFVGGLVALLLLAILGLKILEKWNAEPLARFTAISAFCAICSTAMIDSPLFHPMPILVALALIAPIFVGQQKVQEN